MTIQCETKQQKCKRALILPFLLQTNDSIRESETLLCVWARWISSAINKEEKSRNTDKKVKEIHQCTIESSSFIEIIYDKFDDRYWCETHHYHPSISWRSWSIIHSISITGQRQERWHRFVFIMNERLLLLSLLLFLERKIEMIFASVYMYCRQVRTRIHIQTEIIIYLISILLVECQEIYIEKWWW